MHFERQDAHADLALESLTEVVRNGHLGGDLDSDVLLVLVVATEDLLEVRSGHLTTSMSLSDNRFMFRMLSHRQSCLLSG